MFCGQCGKENTENVKSCIHCGADVNHVTEGGETLSVMHTIEEPDGSLRRGGSESEGHQSTAESNRDSSAGQQSIGDMQTLEGVSASDDEVSIGDMQTVAHQDAERDHRVAAGVQLSERYELVEQIGRGRVLNCPGSAEHI